MYNTSTKLMAMSLQRNRNTLAKDSFRSIYEPDILDEAYYHGFMTRVEAEAYIKQHGSFLVRRIQENDEQIYIISVQWKKEKLHYKICQTQHKNFYYLDRECKRTISSLIRFHHLKQVPINPISKACLIKIADRNHYAIYREQITLGEIIGQGEFGAVYEGVLRKEFFSKVHVAVKTMKQADGLVMSIDERIQFLREANIMMLLKHKNVIRLYGVCVYNDPIWIVLEEAQGGCLLHTLQNAKLKASLKERFSNEICDGMAYLEKYSIIHRDLAARNCLLDDKYTIKIADFGLSIKSSKLVIIKSGRVPIRWMAPETMQEGVFSSKSDVWSYGVVLYEIWENEMSEKCKIIMDFCLIYNHEDRPTFNQLQKMIKS